MKHPIWKGLRYLGCGGVLALLLSTCSTDDSSGACGALCADICQALPACGISVDANCEQECASGLSRRHCTETRPVGQLTCDELRDVYACADYCAALCTKAVACGPFDAELCVVGCATQPALCNVNAVEPRSCDQIKPEARLYEDVGRAEQSDNEEVFFPGFGPGGSALTQFGLCNNAEHCEAPLGCRAETNTCAPCVSDADCTREFAFRASICVADQGCVEVDCASDEDCPSGLCEPVSHTCVDCIRDEHCAAGPFSSLLPACDADTNSCVQCTRHEHCSGSADRPKCASDQRCHECASNADCPREYPRCHATASFCTSCESDAECIAHGLPVCSSLGCAECASDEHCTDPARPVCDPLEEQCVPEPS